jgi:hypothetical protein
MLYGKTASTGSLARHDTLFDRVGQLEEESRLLFVLQQVVYTRTKEHRGLFGLVCDALTKSL